MLAFCKAESAQNPLMLGFKGENSFKVPNWINVDIKILKGEGSEGCGDMK